jgi:hypothetical protein
MTRQQLIEMSKLYARLLLTVDGLWFLETEKFAGLERALEHDRNVWRQYGTIEARRMKQLLSVDSVSTLEDFCRIALLGPMWVTQGHKAEIVDGRCFLSVTDCHPQKARIRSGLGEFPCKSVTLAYFEGFAPELNPGLKFRCLFCPPDEHPEDIWCKWEVLLEAG